MKNLFGEKVKEFFGILYSTFKEMMSKIWTGELILNCLEKINNDLKKGTKENKIKAAEDELRRFKNNV